MARAGQVRPAPVEPARSHVDRAGARRSRGEVPRRHQVAARTSSRGVPERRLRQRDVVQTAGPLDLAVVVAGHRARHPAPRRRAACRLSSAGAKSRRPRMTGVRPPAPGSEGAWPTVSVRVAPRRRRPRAVPGLAPGAASTCDRRGAAPAVPHGGARAARRRRTGRTRCQPWDRGAPRCPGGAGRASVGQMVATMREAAGAAGTPGRPARAGGSRAAPAGRARG